MKKTLFILLCLGLASGVRSQTDTVFRFLRTIPAEVSEFAVDNLDNIYILNSRNRLYKYNANGDSVAVYNDVRNFGQVSLIDVSNPLKVLLYYKDFSTIVMLDRFLNPRNVIDLRKHNILDVKAIGQSYDNKIWIYDELESKLKKIDEDGRLILETPDLRLLLGQAVSPARIFDEDKLVYLYDSSKAIFVFDYYGAHKNNILINHWQNFKVAGKFIYGSRADSLFRYEIRSFRVDEWKLPPGILAARAFNFSSGRLYVLKPEGLEIYSIH